MKTIFSPDTKELVRETLSLFLEQLSSLGNKNSITIGLSGGSSLLSFYEALRDCFPSIDRDIREKIRFAFLDERLVPLDHTDSNYRLISEVLFTSLLSKHLLREEQILSVRTDITDPGKEYSLRVPSIDIGLFGVGPDGHIASLFPGHPWLQDTSSMYILVHDSPKPPSDRISVSVPSVLKIPSVFVFFIGEGKRLAYERFLDSSIKENECPAKYLFACGNCTIVTDLWK